jgi:hypothetical protein
MAHGDFMGSCNNTCTAPVANAKFEGDNESPTVQAESVEMDAYPNPFKTTLSVKVSNPDHETVTMQMMDLTGRAMEVQVPQAVENIYILDTQHIPSGFYILRVNIGRVSNPLKVIKE